MRHVLQNQPEKDLPANPSLCATPEQLEAFKALRCELLTGRATPEQCNQMFEDMRDQMKEDIADLTKALNFPDFVKFVSIFQTTEILETFAKNVPKL